jgi:hypothetical protein
VFEGRSFNRTMIQLKFAQGIYWVSNNALDTIVPMTA